LASSSNELVLQQGHLCTDTYFVVCGALRIVTNTPAGNAVILADLKAGEYFGEMPAIDGEPQSSLRSRQPIQQRTVPAADDGSRRVAETAFPLSIPQECFELAQREGVPTVIEKSSSCEGQTKISFVAQ
jgi:hypothetical protein